MEKRAILPLNLTQARAFLEAVHGHQLEALFAAVIAGGLREGECLGLQWGDVDFEARTITVKRQLRRIDLKLQLVATKTEQSRRTVVMPTVVMPTIVLQRLKAHRVRQIEERLAAGEHWQDHGLIFTSRLGTPIHPENLGRTMRPFFEKAGCPPQRFYDLRHACASLLLAQGVSAKFVQETLGHTLISTTLDLYSHLIPELRQEVADRMDAVLGW